MEKPKADDLRKKITYIDIPEKELKSAIKHSFSRDFNTSLNERSLHNKELSEAKELARMKYTSMKWKYYSNKTLIFIHQK